MLFIGDVHITTKRQEKLLDKIRTYINSYPEERTIIFLGDFVYQFSYDRKALLGLFNVFTDLYKEGKHVYVVAGNHDRIADHFVYEEAKQAFDLISQNTNVDSNGQGLLKFVTQPSFATLEGQDVLFFPFTHHFTNAPAFKESSVFYALHNSVNRNERLSAVANSVLRDLLKERRMRSKKTEKLLLIHHRYIVETAFPGQQAKFSYGSPGLSKELLSMDDVLMVSGHLHQAFVDRNYLCTGSIRHTSSLEVNQQKRLFHRDFKKQYLDATPCTVNPYIMIDGDQTQKVTQELVIEQAEHVQKDAHALLQGGAWNIEPFIPDEKVNLNAVTLLIRSSRRSYSNLEDYLSTGMLQNLSDIKLKSVSARSGELLTDLEQSALALDRSISDRKSLLRVYLQRKYTDRSGLYEAFLQDLELL